jgi:predicted nucleotidyltransferase component of viral defense system
MIEWLKLTEEQRRLTIEQAGARSGITVNAIEKDWWVTLVLKALFATEYAPHLLFKGGTSLSKCWDLIQRFSEDIDIALDREFLGFSDDLNKSQVKKLKREACKFTSTVLREAVENKLLEMGVPEGMLVVTAKPIPADRPDTDPQEILITFPSLFAPIPYIERSVKIEVSARSLKDPWSTRNIESLINKYFPTELYSEVPFPVPAVEPHRTFIEKVFLLHEEFTKSTEKIRHKRMSRHLYDLVSVMDTEHGHKALADAAFYNLVISHRELFHNADISNHAPSVISFIPPEDLMKAYTDDYAIMREQMIYGDAHEFKKLIENLQILLERFRKLK